MTTLVLEEAVVRHLADQQIHLAFLVATVVEVAEAQEVLELDPTGELAEHQTAEMGVPMPVVVLEAEILAVALVLQAVF
jgi:hypothetical protein